MCVPYLLIEELQWLAEEESKTKQSLKVHHLSEEMHIYLFARSSSILKDSEHEMINQTERKGCSREFGKTQLRNDAFHPIEMQILPNAIPSKAQHYLFLGTPVMCLLPFFPTIGSVSA